MKFAVVGGLGLLAFIFLAAGLGTPLAQNSRSENGIDSKVWVSLSGYHSKAEGNGVSMETSNTFSELNDANNGECGKAVHMAGAVLAFGIIACIMSIAGAGAGFASFKLNPLPIPLGKLGGFLLLGAAVCTFIAWPMAVAFYTTPLCSSDNAKALSEDDSDNAMGMGPCAPLMIVAWLFLIGGGVAGVVLPDTAVAVDMSASTDSSGQKSELQEKLYGNNANAGEGEL